MKCVVCKTDQPIENVMLVTSKANGSTRAICRPEAFYDSKDADGNLETKGHRPCMNPCFRYAVAGASVASISLAWPAEADGGATAYAPKTFPIRPWFQKVLDRQGVSRISVGNPEALEAQSLPRGDGILVVGKNAGRGPRFGARGR